MNILVVGNFGVGWDGSICDEEHIAAALEELGHTVYRVQREQASGIPLTDDLPDFTLIAQWDGYGDISHLPKPLVYWAFDYQDKGQDWHERLVNMADLYLSKPFSDSFHKNWRWCSQDFAPSFLDKWEEPISVEKYEQPPLEKDIDVLFTGSWVPWESGQDRVKMLKAVEQNFNLQINSVTPEKWREEGFKNVEGPVMDDALPGLIARAKINFSMDHVYAPGYWSDRNAQIMSCGGFVAFRYVPFSEATFGSHIANFYDEKTCIDTIEYYLMNDEEREAIAINGYHYAKENLSVVNRVHQMLTIVGEIL